MKKFIGYNVQTHEIIGANDLHLLYKLVRLDTRRENYKGIVWVVFGDNAKVVFSFGKYENTDFQVAKCVVGDVYPRFYTETQVVFDWALKSYENGYKI